MQKLKQPQANSGLDNEAFTIYMVPPKVDRQPAVTAGCCCKEFIFLEIHVLPAGKGLQRVGRSRTTFVMSTPGLCEPRVTTSAGKELDVILPFVLIAMDALHSCSKIV